MIKRGRVSVACVVNSEMAREDPVAQNRSSSANWKFDKQRVISELLGANVAERSR